MSANGMHKVLTGFWWSTTTGFANRLFKDVSILGFLDYRYPFHTVLFPGLPFFINNWTKTTVIRLNPDIEKQ